MSQSQSPGPSGPEVAAMRKVIYSLAELNSDDMVLPEETPPVEAAAMALENVENLATKVENLEVKIDVLEERAPEPGRREYEAMDKADKATVVRQKLKEIAENSDGTAAMKYKDVLQVFDGRPSAGHAYDIMRTAAERDGYNYGEAPDGSKRLTANLKEIEA